MADRAQSPAGVGALMALSVICVAVGLGLVGAGRSPGYAVVGVAVLLAIWARVAQAGFQHKQTMIELWKLNARREVPEVHPDSGQTHRFDPPIDVEGHPEQSSW